MEVFEQLESNVRSYGRSFPTVFKQAEGCFLINKEGDRYYDFLSGAGSLNYGHNHPLLQADLVKYITSNGISHSLDLFTESKEDFLTEFHQSVLKPRGFNYKVQFTGPTGANAVEAALKLARKITGRSNIIAFTNGFHGVTLGALAATGNGSHRGGAGTLLTGVTRMPFAGYMPGLDSAAYLQKMLTDFSSGLDMPAAILVETIQGEGGLNAASNEWLKKIEAICQKHKILLIVDDIQSGCGRSGDFFSFECAGINPDIVTLSKSISGYGMPMALTLMKPEHDIWKPGEHNGTFRGNNLAFVTAHSAIKHFWRDNQFEQQVAERAEQMRQHLEKIRDTYGAGVVKVKGRGFMTGIELANGTIAGEVTAMAFDQGLVIETGGPDSEVIKCLAPLIISESDLEAGLSILENCVAKVLNKKPSVVIGS